MCVAISCFPQTQSDSHVQEFECVSDLDEDVFDYLYSAMPFVIHDT